MSSAATGTLSVLGTAPETTKGTPVAATKYVKWATNGITSKPDQIRKKLASATRQANRVNVPGKFKTTGAITLPLWATMGAGLYKPAFGAITGLTALAADTVKTATPVATSNGISTITVTNTGGALTYTVGAWIKINTGTSSELRQILTITGNTAPGTILTVGALITNATAAPATAVQQVAQLQFTTTPTAATLPSLTLELNEGRQYSWQLAGVLVNDWAVKFGKEEAEQTFNVFGTVLPKKIATTSPSFSAGELLDELTPFTSTDTQFALYQDPAQAGGSTAASAQQMATYVETFDCSFKNGLIEKVFHDQTQAYNAFAGDQDVEFKYSYSNVSGRLAEFEDYLTSLNGLTVPMVAGAARNQSNTGSDKWAAFGLYAPYMTIMDVTPTRKVGDLIMADVAAYASNQTVSGDLVQAFVVSNTYGATTTGL